MSERQGRCPGLQCHKITRSQEIFQSVACCFKELSGRVLDDQIFNSQEGSSGLRCALGNPGPWKHLFRKCCCRFHVHGSRKAAPSRSECIPGPLQDQGDAITAQESRHVLIPTQTCILSFRLICNSFSLHKVLDQKNCLYRENFWNSLSSICCRRI